MFDGLAEFVKKGRKKGAQITVRGYPDPSRFDGLAMFVKEGRRKGAQIAVRGDPTL